ncbi:MAG: hypothetical protein K6E74_04930, partial [Bacilli bacterium]|nr:hypothetical protein [Bacilli bacterium]
YYTYCTSSNLTSNLTTDSTKNYTISSSSCCTSSNKDDCNNKKDDKYSFTYTFDNPNKKRGNNK